MIRKGKLCAAFTAAFLIILFSPLISEGHIISASSGSNGSISPSGFAVVEDGGSQCFTMTPNTGYRVANVTVDGSSVGARTSYCFNDVKGPHSISVSFELEQPVTHTISASAGSGGRISPSGVVMVEDGSSQCFSITPDPGYRVADVTVDGGSVGARTSYCFNDVKGPHSISVSFELEQPVTYTISAIAGSGGSISPSGVVVVEDGGSQCFTITPDPGYRVADVTVNGDSIGARTSYCFENVKGPHSISVSFERAVYVINASAESNGSISPSGEVRVQPGGSQTFAIRHNEGYHVTNVTVDGRSEGAVTSYTFTNVTSNHNIHASFEINTYIITATAGSGGSISPSGAVKVQHGGSQTFNIKPDEGYRVADVAVDGISVGAITSYYFKNIRSSRSISVSFEPEVPTIAATAGNGGSISPSGAVKVQHGGSQTFIIKPDEDYHVLDVIVDGKSEGTVTSYTFSNVASDHTIEVTFEINTYTITATAGEGGSISPSGAVKVQHGESQTFIIKPDTGYHVLGVTVDGKSEGTVTSYTFTNVTSDHKIEAAFEINTYTITATAGEGGSIEPEDKVKVQHGESQTFTIKPDDGYHVLDVTVDGKSEGGVTSYTFTNVTSDRKIEASFEINIYTITATAGEGGSISPSGAVKVQHGESQTFIIKPDEGYHVLDVVVDGKSEGVVTSYTFTDVTSDHKIEVTFEVNIYTITATAGKGGSISPSDAVKVQHGGSQTFTIKPDEGYHVKNVTVDGKSEGGVTSHTFTNVTSDREIEAAFEINTYIITATADKGGSISPSDAVKVQHGGSQTFIIRPDEGYHVLDVTVDGKSEGVVTSHTFTNVTSDREIEAAFEINTYTITATAGEGGSISPSGEVKAQHGESQTFTIEPDPGYYIVSMMVDGTSVGATSTYTFPNVESDHTISAIFGSRIVATSGNCGSIAPGGEMMVACGENREFAVIPDEDHYIKDVLVDGVSVGAMSAYTFENLQSDHTIHAVFGSRIAASLEGNGSIKPEGGMIVECGKSQAFTIEPAQGWYIKDVLVDGVSAGAQTEHTFNSVTSDHTIRAIFGEFHIVEATSGNCGTIEPMGQNRVNHGGSVTFTIEPSPNYYIKDVLADSVSVGAISAYTFENVRSDHTIHATFGSRILATSSDCGSIEPEGPVIVACGEDQEFAIIPDGDHYIKDVLIDGVSVGPVPLHIFQDVASDHTLHASFGSRITSESGNDGSIEPAGEMIIGCGEDAKFTITANQGYHIKDILVNDSSVGSVRDLKCIAEYRYTFEDVTSDHTIYATFSALPYIDKVVIDTSGKSISTAGDMITVEVIQKTGSTLAARGQFDIGGINSVKLYNDGMNGDALADDRIWTGRYVVKQGDDVNNASVKARLYLCDEEFDGLSEQQVSIDTIPPRILDVQCEPAPAPEGELRITIDITEEGSGMDELIPPQVYIITPEPDDAPETVEVELGDYTVHSEGAVWRGAVEILTQYGDGRARLIIDELQDRAGNSLIFNQLQLGCDIDVKIIENVSFSPPGPLRAGDVLTVLMIGKSGGRAYFDIEDPKKPILNVEMNEIAPGEYEGKYTVQLGDNVTDAKIVGYLYHEQRAMSDRLTIDTDAPNPPGNFTVTQEIGCALTLKWEGSESPDVQNYRIYLIYPHEEALEETRGNTEWQNEMDDGLYEFGVSAVDAAGNESVRIISQRVEVNCNPEDVVNLALRILPENVVQLSWESPSDDIVEYEVDYGIASEMTENTIWRKNLENLCSLTFTVKAIDRIGNMSKGVSLSNEPPIAEINNVESAQRGNVVFGYHLDDKQKEPLDIDLEYRRTGSLEWKPATVTYREKQYKGWIDGIEQDEYVGEVIWNSYLLDDIPSTGDKGIYVQFRMTPRDNCKQAGQSDIAGEFKITNILCDYNHDGKVDGDDLKIFEQAWKEQDLTREVGPVAVGGTPPDLIPFPDGVIDYEDLKVFGRMWLWSAKEDLSAPIEGITGDDPAQLSMLITALPDLEILASRIISPGVNAVLQNYPNPFNPETWIPFQLAEDANVCIKIHSHTGQIVRIIDLGYRHAGFFISKLNAAYWDGNNEAGEKVASGIYFYTIQAGDFTATKKMVVEN